MKRILVTCGAGFIGSHIVEPFQGKCEIRGLEVTVKSYVEALKSGR